MASSLGSAIGAAVSLAVFTAVAGSGGSFMGSVVTMEGRLDNVDLRQAAMFALGINLVFLLLAILSIVMTVPKGGGSRDLGRSAPSPAPESQLPPDEAKEAVIAKLSTLSLAELEDLERQVLVNEVARLEPRLLRQIVDENRG